MNPYYTAKSDTNLSPGDYLNSIDDYHREKSLNVAVSALEAAEVVIYTGVEFHSTRYGGMEPEQYSHPLAGLKVLFPYENPYPQQKVRNL